MTFQRHLTDSDIDAIRQAAINVGLAGSRDALLSGLSADFRASLPEAPNPAQQLHRDLQTMNTIERLVGDEEVIPLQRWLSTAYQFSSFRSEAKVFKDAQEKIAAGVAARALAATRQQQSAHPLPDAGFVAPATPVVVTPVAPRVPRPSQPVSTTPFPATAAVISIAGLAAMPGPDVPDAMAALHRVLRAPIDALPGIRVLSSLTGAVILVPDTLNRNAHEPSLLPAWLAALTAAGLAVHAGVARGPVEWVEDADGTVNATGRCINIAARLAASGVNPGALYEIGYADHVLGALRSKHFLYPDNRVPLAVAGKREEVFTCFADPGFSARTKSEIREEGSAPFVNAVLLAYDLPGFSDGDLRTLASRFRGVSQEVRRLRAQNMLPPEAEVTFSPGGDGGLLAITHIPPDRALGLATELAGLLDDASDTRTAEASVWARIGVHYGQTQAYENAEGVTRPTGLALLEADALAGDEEARRWAAVVISGALIEGPSRRYQEIGPFETAHRKKIRRFVPGDARPRTVTVVATPSPLPVPVGVAPGATAPAPPAPQRSYLWPAKLSGTDVKELRDALLSAFPSRSALEQMVRFHLEESLDAIAGPGGLAQTIFELVQYAEARGLIPALFEAAIKDVPGNPALAAIAAKRHA